MKAIQIIQDEHRALAAVLHGLLFLVRKTREHGEPANFPVLSAMLYYIDAFPERFHHPKEDRYLFPAVRMRAPQSAAVLNELEADHRAGADKLRSLMQAFTRYREGGDAEFDAFADAAEAYAAFHREHMHKEESQVLPLARQALTAADWEGVDAAFQGHLDPMLGAQPAAQWDHFFSRITNLAPPPIGVGPERGPA